MNQSENVENIRKDRMRFKQNSLSGNLALLSVVTNVIFFISVYKVNSTFMYNPLIAISILYNLVFLLTTILSSQGVKAYNKNFAIALLVIGCLQIVRIFILPLRCLNAETDVAVIDTTKFSWWVIFLVSSATLLFASGITGLIKSKIYHDYIKSLAAQCS